MRLDLLAKHQAGRRFNFCCYEFGAFLHECTRIPLLCEP
jgi:hypothetical protein